MKRDAGIVAGVAAVLMIFGLSGRQKQSPTSVPAGSSGRTAASGEKVVPAPIEHFQSKPYLPCGEIVDELLRFVPNPEETDSKRLPDSCYAQKRTNPNYLRAFSGVTFAIATVPDPVSTHLPLVFDRMVQSILQAAQDNGYSFEGSWFPWDVARKDYAYLRDQLQADELQEIQQTQPGVMVFRRPSSGDDHHPQDDKTYEGGLVIFVVGEKPTWGLSDDQFDNALAWLLQLGPPFSPVNKLRILGPMFSGSLPSLRRALERSLDRPDKLGGYRGKGLITMSSGSVSSGSSYSEFEKWITQAPKNGTFTTALENDDLVTERFCRYLKTQGYEPPYVAQLSEDETAFGSFVKHTGEPQVARHPDPEAEHDTPCPLLSL
jgi:hypothetical protein